LRERLEDIPELVKYFFQRYTKELGFPTTGAPTPEAVEFLRQQPWPGNVRELRNIVRKSLLLARGYSITREIIDRALAQSGTPRPSGDESLSAYISELLARAERGDLENVQSALSDIVEKELFKQAIKLARGDQTKAANWIGVSRPTMKDKLLKYGFHPTRDGS
jgi:DNA-binding NtrC family response regulator